MTPPKLENFLSSGKLDDFIIKISNSSFWNKYKINNGLIYYTGSRNIIEKIANKFIGKNFSEKKIKKLLLDHNRNSSVIIKTNNFF